MLLQGTLLGRVAYLPQGPMVSPFHIWKHMKARNACNLSTVHYVKIDRNNYKEATFTKYEQSELFC